LPSLVLHSDGQMKRFEALLLSDTIVSKMVHYSKLHSDRNCSTISL